MITKIDRQNKIEEFYIYEYKLINDYGYKYIKNVQ